MSTRNVVFNSEDFTVENVSGLKRSNCDRSKDYRMLLSQFKVYPHPL
jgi:hypothetical protein